MHVHITILMYNMTKEKKQYTYHQKPHSIEIQAEKPGSQAIQ